MFPERIHRIIYIASLVIIAVSLPLSKFGMSVGQFMLAGNWLLEAGFKKKITSFLQNPAALAASSMYLLFAAGLAWTSDMPEGLKDLRIKAPLFIFPLLVATSAALRPAHFNWVIKAFISAVLVGSLISTAIWTGIYPRKVVDIRDISIFVSHIRFSLMICLSVFLCLHFVRIEKALIYRLIASLIAGWLLLFLFILQSLTGIIIFGICGFFIAIFYSMKVKQPATKWACLLAIGISLLGIYFYAGHLHRNFFSPKSFQEQFHGSITAHGNRYVHDTLNLQLENGYYVWLNQCWPEVETAWAKRSTLSLDGKDLKGNDLRHTLARYLSSRGLAKDQEGISQLSDKEIRGIERGSANVEEAHFFRSRIHQVFWELEPRQMEGNPNGHSFSMRLEFWKTAIQIISQNPLFGVGTGDVSAAFKNMYSEMKSPLEERWRLRSHNQFLTVFVGLGFFGIIFFLFTLGYPPWKGKGFSDYYYLIFILIIAFSMLDEDTLETQAGVTFFAFFNALLLFGRELESGKPNPL